MSLRNSCSIQTHWWCEQESFEVTPLFLNTWGWNPFTEKWSTNSHASIVFLDQTLRYCDLLNRLRCSDIDFGLQELHATFRNIANLWYNFRPKFVESRRSLRCFSLRGQQLIHILSLSFYKYHLLNYVLSYHSGGEYLRSQLSSCSCIHGRLFSCVLWWKGCKNRGSSSLC